MKFWEADFVMIGEWNTQKLWEVKEELIGLWKIRVEKGQLEMANAYMVLIKIIELEVNNRDLNGL